MKCPNCGFENIPNSALCLNCRSALAGKETPITSERDRPKRPIITSKSTWFSKILKREIFIPQPKESLVNPNVAWIFSVIPGLGQFLAGHYVKGLIIFISWLVLISYYLYSFNGFIFTALFLLHTYSFLEGIFTGIYRERSEGVLMSVFVVMLVTGIYYGFNSLINLRIERLIIPGDYWSPALKDRDVVLFDKKVYKNEKPKRGDIVLFQPYTGSASLGGRNVYVRGSGFSVERIIGLPADRIKILKGKIQINEKELPEEFYPLNSNLLPENFEATIPDSHYLLFQTYLPKQYSGFRSIPESSIMGRMIRSYHPFP